MPKPKTKAPVPTEAHVEERPNNYVYMEKSITKNLGDYNSSKITVGITVQVNPTKEELKAVKATVVVLNELLDKEMAEQVKAFES